MSTLNITCPHCGAENIVMANEVPDNCHIICSTCRAPLGQWGEARRKAEGWNKEESQRT